MAKLNYATEYLQTLEQMFPYVLYFGDLFATPNNGRFRWVNSRVIEVPTISTTGRTDGDRDTIGTRKRNYNNEWKPLTLENHRQWQTLVHPRDIAETKGVVAIGNITKVYNEEQKFPEMNAYCVADTVAVQNEKREAVVKSESNDGYSISYADAMNDTALHNEMYRAVSSYLANTGLLNRGWVKEYDDKQ